jgi:hypothetical protein
MNFLARNQNVPWRMFTQHGLELVDLAKSFLGTRPKFRRANKDSTTVLKWQLGATITEADVKVCADYLQDNGYTVLSLNVSKGKNASDTRCYVAIKFAG